MACDVRGNTIICSRGGRGHLGICEECHAKPATVLCDGPLPKFTTHPSGLCSKPICGDCADPDRDYCRDHRDPEKRRLAL